MRKTLPLIVLAVIAVAIALYFTLSTDRTGTNIKSQTDFSIADTNSIGRIFIADRLGKSVTLTRKDNGIWDVNGKFPAREDAVHTLLKTFKNVYIQRPVPKEEQSHVNKVMAGSSRKVEIYDRQGKWLKTWYVGHATMDKKGTYMLLETPRGGRSAVPFVLDMRGFIGMLNTRFFTNESEWRSTRTFFYPEMGLNEVKVYYPGEEENSFRITYSGGNNIQVFPYGSESPLSAFDTTTVKDYLLNFKLASFENYDSRLDEAAEDSVRALTPYQIITVTDPRGKHEVKLWARKSSGEELPDLENPGKEVEKDPADLADKERVYATYDDGELALAQRFVWDKFRAPLKAFEPKKHP